VAQNASAPAVLATFISSGIAELSSVTVKSKIIGNYILNAGSGDSKPNMFSPITLDIYSNDRISR
jgi:hypothetical protein